MGERARSALPAAVGAAVHRCATWSTAMREALANDPLNLLAVDGSANESKGDRDAAAWLPPNSAFDCPHVARQIAVKIKYILWMTNTEDAAIAKVLTTCTSQVLPAAGVIPVVKATPKPVPTTKKPSSKPTPKPTPKPTQQGITPGAFCAPYGAYGLSSKGKLYRCEPSPYSTSTRNRWEPV